MFQSDVTKPEFVIKLKSNIGLKETDQIGNQYLIQVLQNDPSLEEKGKAFDEMYQGLTNQEVLNEVFASPQKELRDEINIELDAQEAPKLLVTF